MGKPSSNNVDLTPIEDRLDALEARVKALEALHTAAPAPEPEPEPEPTPEPEPDPVPSGDATSLPSYETTWRVG